MPEIKDPLSSATPTGTSEALKLIRDHATAVFIPRGAADRSQFLSNQVDFDGDPARLGSVAPTNWIDGRGVVSRTTGGGLRTVSSSPLFPSTTADFNMELIGIAANWTSETAFLSLAGDLDFGVSGWRLGLHGGVAQSLWWSQSSPGVTSQRSLGSMSSVYSDQDKVDIRLECRHVAGTSTITSFTRLHGSEDPYIQLGTTADPADYVDGASNLRLINGLGNEEIAAFRFSLDDTDNWALEVDARRHQGKTRFYSELSGEEWELLISTGSDTNDPVVIRGADFPYLYVPNAAGAFQQAAGLSGVIASDDSMTFTSRIHTTENSTGNLFVMGTQATQTWLLYNADTRTLSAKARGDSGAALGNVSSPQAVPSRVAAGWFWVRATVNIDSSVNFEYSESNTQDPGKVVWVSLGTATGSNPSTNFDLINNSPIMLVGADTSGAARGEKLISYASFSVPSRTTVWDPSTSLGDGVEEGNSTWTDRNGVTWTVGRPTSGLKTVMVHGDMIQSDGVDDYIQLPASLTPSFTATTGAFTVVAAIRSYVTDASWGRVYSAESANNDGVFLALNPDSNARFVVGGAVDAAVAPGPVGEHTPEGSGVLEVIGGVYDNGSAYTYINGHGLGAAEDTTGVGTITMNTPRLLTVAYNVLAPEELDLFGVVTFDRVLTESELDSVAEYLRAVA